MNIIIPVTDCVKPTEWKNVQIIPWSNLRSIWPWEGLHHWKIAMHKSKSGLNTKFCKFLIKYELFLIWFYIILPAKCFNNSPPFASHFFDELICVCKSFFMKHVTNLIIGLNNNFKKKIIGLNNSHILSVSFLFFSFTPHIKSQLIKKERKKII